eukprot:Protomagalhaensia_wolfi_Nauph_80__3975@NODE_4027_length_656_cov_1016_965964_g3191_i0_p2_GENE_NODE_4027_length_656_cov_1016_965964_g3191_i0NODE_4027_length_656_cov_1016_965964_g3191_i0_p2_ORF_typecomplete_len129_score25_41Ribosomal_L14e/PF01929_17/3_1e11Planc_extracel/PF07595_12/0_011AKAP7_NLS/PF10469_9/0_015_NODE_4027_length_656_cov_1016_965964_g3191_i0136522
MGVFRRFVQAGRAVICRYGPCTDKPAIITDIVDLTRVIIDGPTTGVPRQMISLNRLHLTEFVVDTVKRGCDSDELAGLLKESDVIQQIRNTPAQRRRLAMENLKCMSDLDRHRVMRANQYIKKAARAM